MLFFQKITFHNIIINKYTKYKEVLQVGKNLIFREVSSTPNQEYDSLKFIKLTRVIKLIYLKNKFIFYYKNLIIGSKFKILMNFKIQYHELSV